MFRLKLIPALLAAGLSPAFAQTSASAEELDQRLRVLERQLELAKEDAETKAKDATTTKIDEKGVSIKKRDFELKIKGLVQADIRTTLGNENVVTNDSALFRRIRPSFEGGYGKWIGFRLTPEFAGTGAGEAASIVDAYLDLKFDPAYTLRVGKVKGPVGLERLQSGGAIGFVERGFPTELAPNRDLGIQLQGDVLNSTLSYTLGYYNGTPDGRDVAGLDGDNRKEFGLRLFAEPFRNEPGFFQGLGFGVGSSFVSKLQGGANAATNNNFLPRYRSPGQAQIFNYATGVFADGDHVRVSPQATFYRNSFGLLAEHIRSQQDLTLAANQTSLNHEAWQLLTSYVLSGEDASFRGVVKPESPFAIGGDGWGAFEIALRIGALEIDEAAFPAFASPTTAVRKADNVTLGLNWYLSSNVKAVLNISHTQFEGGGGGSNAAPLDREDEKTAFARLQLSF